MSRVAKKPIGIPGGVQVTVEGPSVSARGPKGTMELTLHPTVAVTQENGELKIMPRGETREHWAMAGTMRALINNMVTGVNQGFERRLQLVGVGYRAQAQGNTLNINLGFSHPITFKVPAGVSVETPTQTEIVIKGVNKQRVGEVAAKIRGYRPPEPYKGKGVRYSDEVVLLKEAKKK